MKKIIFAAIIAAILAGCASSTKVAKPLSYEEVVEFPFINSTTIYQRTNVWAAKTFNTADSKVDYVDEATGTLAGSFVTTVSENFGIYSIDSIRTSFLIEIKDGRVRLLFDLVEVHVPQTDQVKEVWRVPYANEQNKLGFKKICKRIIKDFEKNIEVTEEW